MMMRLIRRLFTTLACIAAFSSAALAENAGKPVEAEVQYNDIGKIVVANRSSGSISVISAKSGELTRTVDLPAAEKTPEPMYVVNTYWGQSRNRVWVGDRANNRVVIFDGNTFAVIGSVPAGAGVFHMWADALGRQLWVVNDVDKTVTVIDAFREKAIATVAMPADLIKAGSKPHDVVLDAFGYFAYVTFIGADKDSIVKFSTFSRKEVDRIQVNGKDPHVSFNIRTQEIYAPVQLSNTLYILDASTLDVKKTLEIPGTHGAATSFDSRRFITTNISGGGKDALFSVDARAKTVDATPVSTAFTTPHNIALTRNARRLFVTHSGDNNKVSVYTLSRDGKFGEQLAPVTVGKNPFGLAYVR